MDPSTFYLNLDIHQTRTQASLNLFQNDTARSISVTLYEDGQPYHISDECVAVLKAVKPDNTVIYNNCTTYADGTVTSPITAQMVAATGIILCQIDIYGRNGQVLASPRFSLFVESALLSDTVIMSTDEYSELAEKIVEVQAIIDAGPAVSIVSVEKTSTSGLVDTYTITFSDDSTTTYQVTNGATGAAGNGIASIAKTATVGSVDTYTVTYTNGSTFVYSVTNGAKGDKGDTGVSITSVDKVGDAGLVDTYQISFSNGEYTFFTVTNGAKGDTGAQGPQGVQGVQGYPGVSITSVTVKSVIGLDVTYDIAFNNGAHEYFTVSNGEKGDKGDKGNKGDTGAQGPRGASISSGTSLPASGMTSGDQFILMPGGYLYNYNGVTWQGVGPLGMPDGYPYTSTVYYDGECEFVSSYDQFITASVIEHDEDVNETLYVTITGNGGTPQTYTYEWYSEGNNWVHYTEGQADGTLSYDSFLERTFIYPPIGESLTGGQNYLLKIATPAGIDSTFRQGVEQVERPYIIYMSGSSVSNSYSAIKAAYDAGKRLLLYWEDYAAYGELQMQMNVSDMDIYIFAVETPALLGGVTQYHYVVTLGEGTADATYVWFDQYPMLPREGGLASGNYTLMRTGNDDDVMWIKPLVITVTKSGTSYVPTGLYGDLVSAYNMGQKVILRASSWTIDGSTYDLDLELVDYDITTSGSPIAHFAGILQVGSSWTGVLIRATVGPDTAQQDPALSAAKVTVNRYKLEPVGWGQEYTVSDNGSVSAILNDEGMYHFTGTLTALDLTLPTYIGKTTHYHFDFISGSTPVTLTLPNNVVMPDGFAVEANKRYEIDIVGDYGTYQSWSITP